MKHKINKKIIARIIDVVITIVIIICIINIAYSLYNIAEWKKDGDDVKRQLNDISKLVNITLVDNDNENVEIIEPTEEIPEYNPYWAYINMNLINVDFYDLKEVNPEAAGWIQINGTNINYPFVQTTNNDYYLTHAFDKSYNSAGWVFLDYRNKADLSDKNNIIYAHGRYDNTMFGTLKNALTNGWLNNKDNFVIKLSTPFENSLWQVFSIYHIPTTSDYLKINFSSNESFLNFSKMLIDRSAYNFETTVNENDVILTLSTCFNDSERVVLHAKLIKKEKR